MYKILRFIVCISCLCITQACTTNVHTKIFGQDAPYYQSYQWWHKSPAKGIPAGGLMVYHPKRTNLIYYITVQVVMDNILMNNGVPGLWVSEDGGVHWDRYGRFRNYQWLYAHPDTGILYAILTEDRIISKSGSLLEGGADKIAMSTNNGRWWIDITGEKKYDINLHAFFKDPDNLDRVCVLQADPEVIWQSKDSEYKAWEYIPIKEWKKRHPEINRTKLLGGLSETGPLTNITEYMVDKNTGEVTKKETPVNLDE